MKIETLTENKKSDDNKFLFGKLDPRLFFVLVGIFTGFEILAMIKTLYFLQRNNFPLSEVPLELFLYDWIIIVSFIYLIAINTRFLLNKRIPWKYIFIFHFVMAMIVNALLRFLFESYTYIRNDKFEEFTTDFFLHRYMAYIDINYLLYAVMIFIIYAYYYMEQIKQAEGEKRVMENILLQTKLKLLVGQMQPHFLFNTLNCIVSLIETDQEKAKKTVVDLSYLLRTILNLKDEQLVRVRTELKILNTYLNIINTRFDNEVEIEKNIDPNIMDIKIPVLVLQPIVENSIKHGFGPDNDRLKIFISMKCDSGKILIEVENDGKPLPANGYDFTSGNGISNLKNRLSSLYGDHFAMDIHNVAHNKGVKTTLSFPS